MRKLIVTTAGAVVLLAALALPDSASAQVSGVQSGYWSQLPGGPQVPAGGTEVASDASGPEAVAAFRFTLPAGESPLTLTLKVSSAQPASQVAVLACPVSAGSAGWKPPSGAGTYSAAPKADCSAGSSSGQLSADGKTMSFDLSSLGFSTSTIDVILEPNTSPSPVPAGVVPGAPSNNYPTFDLAFDPATASSVGTAGAPLAANPPAPAPPATFYQPATTSAPAQPSSSSGLSAALPASAGLQGPVVVPARSAAAPSLASGPAATNSSPAATQVLTPARSVSVSPWRWRAELALGMAIADIFALMWYQQRQQHPREGREPLTIYDPPPSGTAA